MARIPTVTSGTSASSGRTSATVGARRATGEAFGASVGRSLQSVGAGLDRVAQGLHVREENRRREDVANAVAQADFTRRELELRNEVGADAAGYQQRTLDEYDAWVDQQAEGIEDDRTRELFRQRMLAQRNSVSSRAAQYELGTAATHSRNQADASLVALDNRIRLTPTDYDGFIEQGFAVIDARADVPAHVRAQMKETWRENAALSRFEGMLEAATTVDEVEAIQAELQDTDTRDWTAELSSSGLNRVQGLADAAARTIQTRADAQARAVIASLEGRAADVTVTIPREELAAAQAVVEASGNPVTAARMARIVRDQELVEQYRNATPAQVRTAVRSMPDVSGDAPADFDWSRFAIGGATRSDSFTRMTPAMRQGLASMLTAAEEELGAGLQVYSGYRSPELQARLFADAVERYGSEAAARKWVAPPGNSRHNTGQAADLKWNGVRLDQAPEAIQAWVRDNAARFGLDVPMEWEPWQVEEAGARGQPIGTVSPTQAQYEDRQTLERIAADTEQRLADDPMLLAASTQLLSLGDIFAEGGIAARGEQARAVADYYSIPVNEMKPFTEDEAAQLATQFANGTADDVLSMLTSIQQMGGDVARAGMAQIAEVNDVYAYAGGLQLETGQGAIAADVVRGQKRLDENPDIRQQIGATPTDIGAAFMNATGGALLDAAPSQRQAIMDAALAHYVETQVARGRASGFDTDTFAASVQAVLGGRQGAPSLDTVNGSQTVMPPGVTGDALEEAFENMTVADWTSMSEQGEPPRYITGEVADPADLADEAQLRAIGGGRYRVAMSDGSYLITGRPAANGQLEPYIFVPTASEVERVNTEAEARFEARQEEIRQSAERPAVSTQRDDVLAAQADGVLTTEEQQALFRKYGAMWAYDEQGRRIVPPQ